MKLTTFTLLFLFSVLLFVSGCGTAKKTTLEKLADKEVSTFILVRHAEKDYGRDPVLTDLGVERAERLREMLKNTDLDAIFSTETNRTQLTAKPTSEDKKILIQPYNAGLLEEFSDRLKRNFKGKTVLVVGHSNTTPAMANLLSSTVNHPRFSELDYTNMYIVTVPVAGQARVLKLRY
jgi:broad specificity phosphatase PhoE